MTSLQEWQEDVGRAWARNWRRTDRTLAPLVADILARIDTMIGDGASPAHIHDIGCGAGTLTLTMAERWPDARILGIDASADLIDVARDRVSERGGIDTRVRFAVSDAATLSPDGVPDVFASRHGMMFFADPPAAFRHLAQIGQPGTVLVTSAFRRPADNPWVTALSSVTGAGADVPPLSPGPFGFADADAVRALLTGAGWTDVAIEPVDFPFVIGAGADPAADAVEYLSAIGPTARVLRDSTEADRDALLERLATLVEQHTDAGEVRFDAAGWIISARVAPA